MCGKLGRPSVSLLAGRLQRCRAHYAARDARKDAYCTIRTRRATLAKRSAACAAHMRANVQVCRTCKLSWTLACLLPACTEVPRLAACCLPERSRRARRAGVHARCFGLASLDVYHVDVALLSRHKTTSEMTTSEMTTSEPSQTSEKKYQTNACACGSRIARPRDQDSEQEPKSRTKNQEHPSAADRSCAHFVPPGSGRRRPRCSRTRR